MDVVILGAMFVGHKTESGVEMSIVNLNLHLDF